MDPKLQAILKRHNVKTFEFKHVGDYKYLLRVPGGCSKELQADVIAAVPAIYQIDFQELLLGEQLEFDFGGKDAVLKDPSAPIGDAVAHPAHYNTGKIEVIEFIEDQKLSYHIGNAVKYVCRAGRKDPAKVIEDLKKAVWYLQREIENQAAAAEGRAPVRPNDMNPKRKRDTREYGLAGCWVETSVEYGDGKGNTVLMFEPDEQATVRAHLDAGDRGLVFTRL